jgi:hypothetical protein
MPKILFDLFLIHTQETRRWLRTLYWCINYSISSIGKSNFSCTLNKKIVLKYSRVIVNYSKKKFCLIFMIFYQSISRWLMMEQNRFFYLFPLLISTRYVLNIHQWKLFVFFSFSKTIIDQDYFQSHWNNEVLPLGKINDEQVTIKKKKCLQVSRSSR